MAKRKVTVTVDEELIDAVRADDGSTLSAVVNEALEREVERRGRRAALGRLLAEWEAAGGPVSPEAAAVARAAFDELDASVSGAA